ncbi:MAG: hypothetical protein ACTS41_00065 [Candidatus Hodgkinia cicadicola]
MLPTFVLLNTFGLNVTSVFVYWYYRSRRKDKSFVNRYNTLRGRWCETNDNYYNCRMLVKAILTRLVSATLSFPLLKKIHVPLTFVLSIIQSIELWFKTSAGSKNFIYPLCSCFVKCAMLSSSLAEATIALASPKESLAIRKLFWRGTILLWEVFWFISKPKS